MSPGAAMSGLSDANGLGPRELKPDMRSLARGPIVFEPAMAPVAPLELLAALKALMLAQSLDSIEYDDIGFWRAGW